MISFLWIIIAIGTAAVLSVAPHLFWHEIIEGQVGKQNFVAHMTESFARGDLISGFPVRFFAEIWHPGPGPWAEEVPLYHLLSAAISNVFHFNTVNSGRVLSFIFGLFLLYAIYEMARELFQGSRIAPVMAAVLMALTPGFQMYSTSVMPDLPMVALIAFAYSLRLKEKITPAYLVLGVACLFKYFAIFSVGAMFLYDVWRERDLRTRVKSFLMAGLVVFPTIAYVVYFIWAKIPNPVTEYQSANGYGHLAGPFLFHLHFYLRFVTWVFVKNPNVITSALAVAGAALLFKNRTNVRPEWRLVFTHLFGQVLFAAVFASSFFVHDYYALSFLIAIVLLATFAITQIKWEWAQGTILVMSLMWSGCMVRYSTFRLTNYILAGHDVSEVLKDIPDRDMNSLMLFASDFSIPPIPMLSRKSSWAFPLGHFAEFEREIQARALDSRTKAVVFYAREEWADLQWKTLLETLPKERKYHVVLEKHYEREEGNGPGAATVLKILR